MSRSRRVAVAGGLVISALFLYLTFRKVELGELGASLASVSLGILSLSLLTRAGGFLMMTLRSQVLLRPLHPYGFWRQFISILLGFVGNNVLPLRMGELLRVGYLARWGRVPPSSVLAVVALERLLDLFCLMLIFFAVLPLAIVELAPGTVVYLLAGVLLAGLTGAVLVGHRPELLTRSASVLSRPLGAKLSSRLVGLASRFADGFSALSSSRSLLASLLMSLGYWMFGLGSAWLWITALGLSLPWYAPMVVIVFIALGTLLPSAPSFAGTYHYFASASLGVFGVTEAVAASFGVIGHAMAVIPFTLLGIPLLFGDLLYGLRDQKWT